MWTQLSERQWEPEWANVIRMASTDPLQSETRHTRSGAAFSSVKTYSFLETVHVAAIANIVKRPIIVIADRFVLDEEGMAFSNNYIGGKR